MSDIILFSESGKFTCSHDGYAYAFEPEEDNRLGLCDGYSLALMHLVVPEGVAGFSGSFGRHITVKERFILPKSLHVIGQFTTGLNDQCVFANSKLPTVIIPESTEFTGTFAFGDSEIDALCFPPEYTKEPKEYVRAYKGCRVHRLYIHHSAKDTFFKDMNFAYGLRYDEFYTYSHREPGCLPLDAKQV